MELDNLKKRIENIDKSHQIEILRILSKFTNIKTNENNNGTFINLTELPINVINELNEYVNYVEEQQKQLKMGETEKQQIEISFFK
jgi:hypothetical protein